MSAGIPTAAPIRPDLLETSIDKPEYKSGDTMVVSVNARTAGKLTINMLGDRLLTTQSTDIKEGQNKINIAVGKDWGTGAYVVATLRRPLDAARAADAGPRHRPEMVRDRQGRPHAQGQPDAAGARASGNGAQAAR